VGADMAVTAVEAVTAVAVGTAVAIIIELDLVPGTLWAQGARLHWMGSAVR
jgi:hypothetical protein